MAVGEELYFYPYPFLVPNSFLICKNKYDLEIKLQLIESFSTADLEKRFDMKHFFNNFSVPNKDLTKIKKQLIDSFFLLKDYRLIDDKISIIGKNGLSSIKMEELSSGLLSLLKIDFIYFWEKIQ